MAYTEQQLRQRRVSNRRYRSNHPHAPFIERLHRYGLRLIDIQQVLKTQGCRCAICKQPPLPNGSNSGWCLDHSHRTGKFRGLLCHRCNAAIGGFQDDPAQVGLRESKGQRAGMTALLNDPARIEAARAYLVRNLGHNCLHQGGGVKSACPRNPSALETGLPESENSSGPGIIAALRGFGG